MSKIKVRKTLKTIYEFECPVCKELRLSKLQISPNHFRSFGKNHEDKVKCVKCDSVIEVEVVDY